MSVRTSRPRKRRFRFSLNGLAIQLSAFALALTLVALLVVSGSQAAFVEPSEVLKNYVPIGTTAPTEGNARRPTAVRPAVAPPTVSEAPVPPPTGERREPELPDAEIELTDTAAGTALFGNETLLPGIAVERCIAVTFVGTVDVDPVRLYAASNGGDLAPYLDLTISMGEPATAGASTCSGFAPAEILYSGTLEGFATTHTSYATGRMTWHPSKRAETRGFRFRLCVRDVPAAAGKTATFGFSWRTEAS
jgi:hypothetical protein